MFNHPINKRILYSLKSCMQSIHVQEKDFDEDRRSNLTKGNSYHAVNQNKVHINKPISQIFSIFVFKSRRLFPKHISKERNILLIKNLKHRKFSNNTLREHRNSYAISDC